MTPAATPEALEQALAEFQRRNGYHRPEIEELLMEFGELVLATATTEAASLRAEVEALKAERDEARSHLPEGLRDASLTGAIRSLALAASSENENKWRWGRALQIGLAFADKAAGEEWEHDGMASVDACYAMAAILECECGGSVWNEMVRAGTARFAEHAALARAATAGKG